MDFSLLWKALVIGAAILVSIGTSIGWLKWKDDHILEEVMEQMIEKYTHLDIDLTPASPEINPDSPEPFPKSIHKESARDMITSTPSSL